MSLYTTADIGGTSVKLGVADDKGEFLSRDVVPNPVREEGVDAMLAAVSAKVREYKERYTLSGLAVSTAGVVDESGTVLFAGPNFPGYSGVRLAAKLNALCGLPCAVANDANCAALGEAWLGAGKNASPFVCVTLGAGVGSAILIDGNPLSGAHGFAGELGCLPFDGGVLEDRASARALVRFVADAKKLSEESLDGANVLDMARTGDPAALAGIQRQMHALAAGLASVLLIVDPELVVIGGGLAAGADVLGPVLKEELSLLRAAAPVPKTRICFSELGNDAGMLGALSYFLRKKSTNLRYISFDRRSRNGRQNQGNV